MLNYQKIIANVLREFADNIESKNCNISETDAVLLVSTIAHISMSKQEVADRYGVSTKTIERKEKDNLIPPSHTVITSKKLWYLDELLKFENQ